MKNGKLTAIYCRTASGAAEDRFKIYGQEDSLLAFAGKRGYSNPVSYLDNACGGLTFNRQAFSGLTADIRAGKVAVVIMRDLSRVGRDYLSVSRWIDWVRTQGVDIVTLHHHSAELGFPADLQKALMDYARSQNRARASKRKNAAPSSAPAIAG